MSCRVAVLGPAVWRGAARGSTRLVSRVTSTDDRRASYSWLTASPACRGVLMWRCMAITQKPAHAPWVHEPRLVHHPYTPRQQTSATPPGHRSSSTWLLPPHERRTGPYWLLPTNHTPHHIGQYRIPGREARACHHPHAITRVGNKRARALPCDGRQRSTTDNYVRAAKVRERKLCSSAKVSSCAQLSSNGVVHVMNVYMQWLWLWF